MAIIVENSTWNNIGDAFYQSALQSMLQRIFPQEEVFPMDGPIQRAFHSSPRLRSNAFDSRTLHHSSVTIFSGPILSQFESSYQELIEHLSTTGQNYALVSVSTGRQLNDTELDRLRTFLNRYPPVAFATRDHATYEALKNDVPSPYDGICTAFLAPKELSFQRFDEGDYFASSFYSMTEPEYQLNDVAKPTIEDITVKIRTPFLKLPFRIRRQFQWTQRRQERVGNLEIVRPLHSISYRFAHLNFHSPNAYLSHNPTLYLSVYSGARFTITDRVHSAVVSLALGKPVRLYYPNYRCGLFDRVGLAWRNNAVMRLDESVIEQEAQALETYLQRQLEPYL